MSLEDTMVRMMGEHKELLTEKLGEHKVTLDEQSAMIIETRDMARDATRDIANLPCNGHEEKIDKLEKQTIYWKGSIAALLLLPGVAYGVYRLISAIKGV